MSECALIIGRTHSLNLTKSCLLNRHSLRNEYMDIETDGDGKSWMKVDVPTHLHTAMALLKGAQTLEKVGQYRDPDMKHELKWFIQAQTLRSEALWILCAAESISIEVLMRKYPQVGVEAAMRAARL